MELRGEGVERLGRKEYIKILEHQKSIKINEHYKGTGLRTGNGFLALCYFQHFHASEQYLHHSAY